MSPEHRRPGEVRSTNFTPFTFTHRPRLFIHLAFVPHDRILSFTHSDEVSGEWERRELSPAP